jgi:hypothetical protein
MDLMSYIGIGFYYLFFLVGSVTIGYFVLRVSYPEVRTYEQNKKLAVSGMLGLVVVFLSYITNIFFFGVDRFLNIDSYIEIFTVIYSIIFFLVFKYYYSYTPKFITIAMPVRMEAPKVEQVKEQKKPKEKTPEKPFSLQQLKKEVTGNDIEISIPLKTQTFQQEGVEGLKREILGSGVQSIEIPLKQTIEIPFKAREAVLNPVVKETVKPIKTVKPPIPPVQEKAVPYAPFRPAPEKAGGGVEKPVQPPQAAQTVKEPALQKQQQAPQTLEKTQPETTQKQGEGFKFQKQENPVESQAREGFKFQKKEEKPKTKEETEIEGILKDVVKETVEEAQGKVIPKHRRYLLSSQEKEKVRVIASSDMAGKEEFQSLVQDVYEELRKTKTEGNIQKITPNVPAEPAKKEEEKTKEKEREEEKTKEKEREEKKRGREKERKQENPQQEALSLSEVLGGQEGLSSQPKEEKPTGLFAQLSGITEAPKEQQKSEFVKIESESGMGCPNCHAKNTRIVFCPYCGGAMCTNCSPQIKIEGDKFIFTCPHCGEEVSVKKKK